MAADRGSDMALGGWRKRRPRQRTRGGPWRPRVNVGLDTLLAAVADKRRAKVGNKGRVVAADRGRTMAAAEARLAGSGCPVTVAEAVRLADKGRVAKLADDGLPTGPDLAVPPPAVCGRRGACQHPSMANVTGWQWVLWSPAPA